MSKIKKQGNAQIPREAIKGAAGIDAKFHLTSVSKEQILANSMKEEYEMLITNKNVRENIRSTDLDLGSKIKAYTNKEKDVTKKKLEEKEIGK